MWARVVSPFLVGVLSGFVPAMGLLYLVLNRYEGFFDERRVFRMLLVGMFVGTLVTIGEWVFATEALPFAWAVLFAGLGFAVLEAAVKTAVLNSRRFRGRKDTPYYGAAFGLGFGASAALLVSARSASLSFAAVDSPATYVFYAILLQLVVGAIIMHAVTAVLIGQSTAQGIAFVGLARAVMAQLPFAVLALAIYYWQNPYSIAVPTVALVYAVGALVLTVRRVLDPIVPEELAREVRRAWRKQMRAEAEEAPPEPERPG